MACRRLMGFLFLLVLSASLTVGNTQVSAAVFTWGNAGSDWGVASNWSPSGPPTVGSIAQFTSASYSFQPMLLSASESAGAVWDNGAGAVTISGNSPFVLALTGTSVNGNATTGVELDSGAGALTIGVPITIGSSQQWINNSANPITMNGLLNANSKNLTLNTVGSGSLVLAGSVGNMLTGNNSFGNVTITGTVSVPATLFLGFSGSTTAGTATTTTIGAGGLLNLVVAGATNLPISNNVVVNGGTIMNVSAGTGETVGIGWSTNQAGIFTINSGLVNFSGVTVNFGHAHAGTLNLNGGTYVINNEPVDGGSHGTYVFNGGTLKLNGSIATFVPNGIALDVANGGANFNLNGFSTTIGRSLVGTGSGGLAVTGPGTLTLTATGSFTGATTLSGGTLILSNSAVTTAGASILPQNSNLSVTSGKVSLFGSQASFGISDTTAGTVTLNSGGLLSADQTANNTFNLYTLVMNGGTLAATQPAGTNNQHFTINNQIFATGASPSLISANFGDTGGGLTVDVASGSQLTMSGQLADSGAISLTKVNSGTLVITSSNSYAGSTNVNGGTLTVDATGTNTGALGPTGVNVASGASLLARGNTSIASGGSLGIAGGGAIDLRSGIVNTLTVNGNLSLGSGTQGSNLYLALGTGTADLVNATGAASLTGTSVVNISLVSGASIVYGPYDLITAAGGLSAGNFAVGSKPAGFNSYTLSTPTSSALVLSITGNPVPGIAYWTGSASSALADSANQWGIGSAISTSNWSTTPDGLTDPQQVPGAITDVFFTAANASSASGTLSTTLDTGYSVNSLTFAVPSATSITSVVINTNGNSLATGSGGLTLASTSNVGVSISGSGSVVVNGSQNWANNSSQPLLVTAPISANSGATTLTLSGIGTGPVTLGGATSNGLGGGTLSLVLNNASTVTLGGSSANTYSGGTTISSGSVQLAGANALGSGPLTMAAGTLDVSGFSQAVGSFSGSGGFIWNNSGAGVATLSVGAGGGTYSGTIADNDGVHTGGAVAVKVTSAGGELTMIGPNTYSGGTTISGGALNFINTIAIGSGRLTMAGGNLDNATGGPIVFGNVPQTWSASFSYLGGSLLNLGTGPVTVTAPTTITVQNSSGTLEIDGNINGSSALSTAGAGMVVFTGTDTITVPSGNVGSFASNVLSTGNMSFSGGNMTTQPGSTFTILSGLFTVNPGSGGVLAVGNLTSSTPANMLVSGGTYSQTTGNLALGQHAPGILTINSGLVALTNALQFGFGAGNSSGTVNLNGGQLNTPNFSTTVSPADVVNFNGGLLQLTASSANLFGAVPSDITVNILNGMFINLNGHSTTINNVLNGTGSGGLTVFGASAGTLTLAANNTYVGPTQINASTVALTFGGSLGNGAPLTMGGGRLDLGFTTQTVGAVSITAAAAAGNTIQNGTLSGTSYVLSNNSGNAIISAALQDSLSGSAGFTMSGGGTATLSAGNTFSGPTNVYAGTLILDASGGNSGALGGTNVSVSGGAAMVVRGNPSFGTGNLSVAGGGGLDLRDNQVNSFTINGNLSLGSGTQGSNLYFELGTNSNDAVNVTGSAALSGTSTITLSAIPGNSPSVGQYNLINAGGGLSAGNFNLSIGPSLKGFDSYSLVASTPMTIVLTISGNTTPTIAYWTGSASSALSDSANQWGVGGPINTSNWSTTPDGLTDALQVPGTVTDVYLTAANATAVAGSLTTTLDNAYSIAGLFFAGSSGSITGVTVNTGSNVLTLGNDGITLTGSANGTISGSGAIVLNTSQNWANNSNTQVLTVTSPISPASSFPTTLSFEGSGTGGMVLSGVISNGPGSLSLSFGQSGTTLLGGSLANTYSGGTTISAGTVKLGGQGALGNAAAMLTMNGGALDLNGFSPTVGSFSGVGGTVLNNSGSGVATLTVGQGINFASIFSGTIADNDGVHTVGAVALRIIGSGELTLMGTNTYSGGTTVAAASTLNIVSSSAIGTGTLTMAGGSLDNNSGGPVVLGSNPEVWNANFAYFGSSLLNLGTGPVTMNVPTTINVQSSAGTLEIDGNITSGTSQLQITGPGTVVLTGSSTISVPGANVVSISSNVISTGNLNLSGGNLTLQPSSTFTVAGGLVTESSVPIGGVGTVIGNSAGGTAYMVVSGGTFVQANAQLYVAQHGPGLLTITGSGLVSLGLSPLAFNFNGAGSSGTLDLNGGTLQCSGFSTTSLGHTLNFNGGVLELTASSTNLFGTAQANFTSNVDDGGMIVNLNGYSTRINDALIGSGSGGLTVTSANGGSLILDGTDTYTGGTYVEGGELIVANNQSIEAGTTLIVGNPAELGALAAAQAGDAVATTRAVEVPEPGTLALMAAAFAVFLLRRRWRSSFYRASSNRTHSTSSAAIARAVPHLPSMFAGDCQMESA